MNNIEMEAMLYGFLQRLVDVAELGKVRTFEDAGLLTGNRGVVVRMVDGSEFQISIVQSH